MNREMLEDLRTLVSDGWIRLYCQSGILVPQKANVYSVPSLIIETTSKKIFNVGFDTIDVGNDEYVAVCVREEACFGSPDYERKFYPRRQEIRSFPSDCDLTLLNNRTLTASLVRLEETTSLLDREPSSGFYRTWFDGGLLIRSSADDPLLIFPNETIFLNLNLTMSKQAIEGFLKRSHELIPL